MSDAFVFPDRFWFLAPPFTGTADLCLVLLRGAWQEAGATPERVVYMFTDADLAERYLAGTGAPAHYRAYAPANDAELLAVLAELSRHGDRIVLLDPGDGGGAPGPLADLADHVRWRSGR